MGKLRFMHCAFPVRGLPVIPVSLANLEVKEEEYFGEERRGQQLCHFPLNLSICCYGNPGAWCRSNRNCHPLSRCSRAGSGWTPAANSPAASRSPCSFSPPGALISGRGSPRRVGAAPRPRARAAQRRRKGRGGGGRSPGAGPDRLRIRPRPRPRLRPNPARSPPAPGPRLFIPGRCCREPLWADFHWGALKHVLMQQKWINTKIVRDTIYRILLKSDDNNIQKPATSPPPPFTPPSSSRPGGRRGKEEDGVEGTGTGHLPALPGRAVPAAGWSRAGQRRGFALPPLAPSPEPSRSRHPGLPAPLRLPVPPPSSPPRLFSSPPLFLSHG